ncbi:Hsp20 family protein [Aliikangiella sp. IMCC44653]
MNTISFTPVFKSSNNYERLTSLLDTMLSAEQSQRRFPDYDIAVLDENQYAISLAVVGFERDELTIQEENGVLAIQGNTQKSETESEYLHQGITKGDFECKFNLPEYVEVKSANLRNGILTIQLVKEVPDSMQPRTIQIGETDNVIKSIGSDGNKAEAQAEKEKTKAA